MVALHRQCSTSKATLHNNQSRRGLARRKDVWPHSSQLSVVVSCAAKHASAAPTAVGDTNMHNAVDQKSNISQVNAA